MKLRIGRVILAASGLAIIIGSVYVSMDNNNPINPQIQSLNHNLDLQTKRVNQLSQSLSTFTNEMRQLRNQNYNLEKHSTSQNRIVGHNLEEIVDNIINIKSQINMLSSHSRPYLC